MKNLSKNCWFVDVFCYSPNNYEEVSHKITEFHKEKTRGKEHNSSQSVKSKESSNDLSILDHVRLNNANRLIISHLNINSLRNNFEVLREIVQDKLDILLISETKADPSFPSSQSVLDLHFELTEIVHEVVLCYLLGKKFLQNS